MENATEALRMGVAVLIFVLALSISINAFGQVRQTTQMVLNYHDREYDYSYVQYEEGTKKRIVSAETIIPAIYKAYKENYKIVFKGLEEPLYKKTISNVSLEQKEIYTIDLENEVLGSNGEKETFIKCLLYGSQYEEEIQDFKKSGIFLNGENFYDTIKGSKFEESLGVYYQEELQGQTNTPDANRTKKRVITYTKK